MSKENKEKDVIRPYVVDGIQEYDNPMPSWWVAMFYATIIFGVVYLFWVHLLGKSTLETELKRDQDRYAELRTKRASLQGAAAASFDERAKDPQLIASGKEVFSLNCSPCHGAAGEGVVGPNLADKFWLNGSTPGDIVNVISKGVPAKGMVAWETILGIDKIEAVAAFVMSLQGTNPPNGKAPEGEEAK